jgi:hypothetical protein
MGFRLVLLLVAVLAVLGFLVLGFLAMLGFMVVLGLVVVLKSLLVLRFLVVLEFLVVLTSSGGGSRLTPSGIAGTRLGTARRARRRCRWLMAATG